MKVSAGNRSNNDPAVWVNPRLDIFQGKNKKRGIDLMSHIIIEFAVGKPDAWMQEKLEGFIWVLDQNLRNNKLGHAEGKYDGGIMTVKASGISLAETRSLVDTFAESMRNHGQRLIVHVREVNGKV